ncbi:hypothetical protein [Staphylococcus pasteuri]|uniref:hypothetical protein n=1 Tax=Staphylococcus pasteuri TaxID=45972 RepID=UPI0003C0972F|nr:hypothetical protein [Staphylococcus pasteuri]AGZ26258.1 hypothetical protein STP1_1962 [Staphylococcus pasteuri SP1]
MNAEAKFVSSVMDARLKKAKRERDSFRKQRDELINDMAETKRKAEAFDEIVNAVDESANSYELVARIKLEVLKYQKLEREE